MISNTSAGGSTADLLTSAKAAKPEAAAAGGTAQATTEKINTDAVAGDPAKTIKKMNKIIADAAKQGATAEQKAAAVTAQQRKADAQAELDAAKQSSSSDDNAIDVSV